MHAFSSRLTLNSRESASVTVPPAPEAARKGRSCDATRRRWREGGLEWGNPHTRPPSERTQRRRYSSECPVSDGREADCSQHTAFISSRDANTGNLTCLPTNCVQAEKQQSEPDMVQQTGSKSGKECVRAGYHHPACLTCMQSTSCEMPGWMKHKLESRLLGEISITSDMQMTPPLWQKVKKNSKAS